MHDVRDSSTPQLTINTLESRGEPLRARLCLAGDIDDAANDTLRACVDWLIMLAPSSVVIDLAEITFAGAALPNFVVQASAALSGERDVVPSGANPMTRWVLQMTDMAEIATITTDAQTRHRCSGGSVAATTPG